MYFYLRLFMSVVVMHIITQAGPSRVLSEYRNNRKLYYLLNNAPQYGELPEGFTVVVPLLQINAIEQPTDSSEYGDRGCLCHNKIPFLSECVQRDRLLIHPEHCVGILTSFNNI